MGDRMRGLGGRGLGLRHSELRFRFRPIAASSPRHGDVEVDTGRRIWRTEPNLGPSRGKGHLFMATGSIMEAVGASEITYVPAAVPMFQDGVTPRDLSVVDRDRFDLVTTNGVAM